MNKSLITLLTLGAILYLAFKSNKAEAAEITKKKAEKPITVRIPGTSKTPFTKRINNVIVSTNIPKILKEGFYLTEVKTI